jgi:FHS family L-fucose permease-like MFS transporter
VSNPRQEQRAFAAVTTLFFAWGFITSLVDPLVAAMKTIFRLSNVEAQLTAFAFFIAYGLVSLPAAGLIGRMGQIPAALAGLGMMAGGCFVILGGGQSGSYEAVLAGLFLIASGITVLQVAANPLAAVLGRPERSHFRLTLSQAFNSLGTVLGPLIGARLLLRDLDKVQGAEALGRVGTSFLMLAGLIAALALFLWRMRRPIEQVAPPVGAAQSPPASLRAALRSRWAVIGAGAIFLYVGAEVAIGTQMALFLHDGSVWNVPLEHAGYYVSLYWLGAMIGRFIGSGLLLVMRATTVLLLATLLAAVLCLAVVMQGGGVAAGYAALAIGLFNSIMFPTIFTLTLERSTAGDEATSGLLCTAIVGGAFVPLLVGKLADQSGHAASFIVPMLCYLALTVFAWAASRVRVTAPHGARPTLH